MSLAKRDNGFRLVPYILLMIGVGAFAAYHWQILNANKEQQEQTEKSVTEENALVTSAEEVVDTVAEGFEGLNEGFITLMLSLVETVQKVTRMNNTLNALSNSVYESFSDIDIVGMQCEWTDEPELNDGKYFLTICLNDKIRDISKCLTVDTKVNQNSEEGNAPFPFQLSPEMVYVFGQALQFKKSSEFSLSFSVYEANHIHEEVADLVSAGFQKLKRALGFSKADSSNEVNLLEEVIEKTAIKEHDKKERRSVASFEALQAKLDLIASPPGHQYEAINKLWHGNKIVADKALNLDVFEKQVNFAKNICAGPTSGTLLKLCGTLGHWGKTYHGAGVRHTQHIIELGGKGKTFPGLWSGSAKAGKTSLVQSGVGKTAVTKTGIAKTAATKKSLALSFKRTLLAWKTKLGILVNSKAFLLLGKAAIVIAIAVAAYYVFVKMTPFNGDAILHYEINWTDIDKSCLNNPKDRLCYVEGLEDQFKHTQCSFAFYHNIADEKEEK
eukprot:Nk52_evm13s234 gene=Nk52_evmTU13s234